jgi:hypothetical protein
VSDHPKWPLGLPRLRRSLAPVAALELTWRAAFWPSRTYLLNAFGPTTSLLGMVRTAEAFVGEVESYLRR